METNNQPVISTNNSPLISVIIVNANGLHHLKRCLPALLRQSYPNYEVLVVDNASTDGSVEALRKNFPDVRVIQSNQNLGFAGGNNLGFDFAQGDYFALLNPDTVPEREWLGALVTALENNPGAGLATSKIVLMDTPDRLNACGNLITVTGITTCRGIGQDANNFNELEDVPAVSGAAFMVRRSLIETIGPFDADFFMYLEETDLSLRTLLAGFRILYVPDSRVAHEYSFQINERKMFDLEKNRYIMLVKSFKGRTLLIISPILLISEFMVWGFLILNGPLYVRQKILSYRWLWQERKKIHMAHNQTQKTRKITDNVLFSKLTPQLQFEQLVSGNGGKILNQITKFVFTGLSRLSALFI